jgi:hypothetical protein
VYYYGSFYRVNNYNNDKAVKYALTYALAPNPEYRYLKGRDDGGGDCTNFISQCLKAGGAPFAYDSSPWWYNIRTINPQDDRWSMSWTVAHSLYWTLKRRGKSKLRGLSANEVQEIDLLELGDLIQYEDKNGLIYHSAIVTAFIIEKGIQVPLISQHSVDGRNVTHIKPKAKKMHFMKIQVV